MPGNGCTVGADGESCGKPGRMYFLGCVHEHAGQRELCLEHAVMMSGRIWCVQCAKGPGSHECMVMLREVTHAG